jgi:hypothetical protein
MSFSRLVSIALAMFIATNAMATLVGLASSSLPSSQGWTYVSTAISPSLPVPEGAVASIVPGAINLNTLGIGQTRAYWQRTDVFNEPVPYEISFGARVISEDPNPQNRFGFSVAAFIGGQAYGFGIGTDRIQNWLTSSSVSFDNTTFRTYLVRITPGVGYQLFADGQLILSDAAYSASGVPANGIQVGDITAGANASSQIQFLQVTAVPEPTSAALLLLGVALGLVWAVKRQRSDA